MGLVACTALLLANRGVSLQAANDAERIPAEARLLVKTFKPEESRRRREE